MKFRLRQSRARSTVNLISDNTNVSFGIVDCLLYTRCIALKDDYHKKRLDMFAYSSGEFNFLETPAMTFINPARPRQLFQEEIFTEAPVRRIDIAMITNSAFTGSNTKNPFWYQPFDLRQIIILRGGQSHADFDPADNCRLRVTKMKAMNFQDDIPSNPIDVFKDHYVTVFDLTAKQDDTENFHYPEKVGKHLRLELNITYPQQNVTELIVLEERTSSVAADKFGFVERIFKMVNVALQQIMNLTLKSAISYLDRSLRNMFQLFPMSLLPLQFLPICHQMSMR